MNNEKMNSKIKLSKSFVILIFVILKFRNISRSTSVVLCKSNFLAYQSALNVKNSP